MKKGTGGDSPLKRRLPFEGLRVLEFTAAVVGPYVGKILADYGAEVIIVESRLKYQTRRMAREPGRVARDRTSLNLGHLFNKVATNKLAVTINLGTPQGIGLVRKLVPAADVVIDNFTPRVLERWGLTYGELTRLNPDIIMLRMPTVATSGPYKNQTSVSWNLLAMSGLNYMSGYPDRPPISPSRYSYPDESSSFLCSALALLSALYHKARTGRGQYVEVSLYESSLTLSGLGLFEYMVNGQLPARAGNQVPYAAPHGVYRCRGEDRWCAIAVLSDDEWRSLCRAIGQEQLAGKPEFSTRAERLKHAAELDVIVENWTGQRKAEDVMKLLQAAGIAAGVVQNVQDLLNDPQLRRRRYWKESIHPEAGKLTGAEWGFRLSAAPHTRNERPPLLGEHNDYVLGKLLGLPEEEINKLIVEGVLQ
ncbi:MAG: CoA transferase [Chloroflexi bacterium]|nr:CoA transferase [Chloroflexota bacterium]